MIFVRVIAVERLFDAGEGYQRTHISSHFHQPNSTVVKQSHSSALSGVYVRGSFMHTLKCLTV